MDAVAAAETAVGIAVRFTLAIIGTIVAILAGLADSVVVAGGLTRWVGGTIAIAAIREAVAVVIDSVGA